MAGRPLLTDLALERRPDVHGPVYRVALREPDRGGPEGRLEPRLVRGRDNLAQALLVRLLTPRGELAELGHPGYGSRLHELIGRLNNDTVRNLVRLYVLEAVERDPRVAEVSELTVRTRDDARTLVEVQLVVVPEAEAETVRIGPFSLELER